MLSCAAVAALGVTTVGAIAQPPFAELALPIAVEIGSEVHITPYAPQMAAKTDLGWNSEAIFTVGETIRGYTAPGVPDGMYAFKTSPRNVKVFLNHEVRANFGYPYTLANGTELTGARISFFNISSSSRLVNSNGLAYDTIYARNGEAVDEASDLDFNGINRLCSANGVEKGSFGFMDDVFLSGEETRAGGTLWALDGKRRELWAVPAAGRAAFESVSVVEPPSDDTVAFLVGDDRPRAPLLLYIGQKFPGDFLTENGLAEGSVYVWVADEDGVVDPGDFSGTGNTQSGAFVEIDVYNPDLAGTPGYDELGYAYQFTQDAMSVGAAGSFQFARLEDVHTPDRR